MIGQHLLMAGGGNVYPDHQSGNHVGSRPPDPPRRISEGTKATVAAMGAGALYGSVFGGPVGALIGAGIGGVAGLIVKAIDPKH